MGASQSHNTDTINWNGVDTNAMSSSIQNIKGLSNEASQLVAKLNLQETDSSEFNTERILGKINGGKNTKTDDKDEDDELSSSSPFINTDMYNYIVKNKNSCCRSSDYIIYKGTIHHFIYS